MLTPLIARDICARAALRRVAGLASILLALAGVPLTACGDIRRWAAENDPWAEPGEAGTAGDSATAGDAAKPGETAVAAVKPRTVQTRRPARPAPIDPAQLVGLDREAAGKLLGRPDLVLQEGPSLVWAYRAAPCVLRVAFYPNIETKEFYVLQYTVESADGRALEDARPCMEKIQSSKRHDGQ